MRRHDYLPFGEELSAGQGGRDAARGYNTDSVKQKYTGYERDAETRNSADALTPSAPADTSDNARLLLP